jgi:hypothetical protein
MSNESIPGITLTVSEGALASLASAIRDYNAQEQHRSMLAAETCRAERQAYTAREDEMARRDALLRQEQDVRVAAAGKDLLTFLLAERAKQDDLRTQLLVNFLDILRTATSSMLSKKSGDEPPIAPLPAEEDENATAAPSVPDFDAWASGDATKDEDEE